MFRRNPSELFLVEQSRDNTIDSRAWSYSAVSTVQSSRPTRTVCSDWATGLRVSSTRTGYPPTHLLWVKSSIARFAASRGNLSSSQRGANGRVENRVYMSSRTFLDSSFLTPFDLM